MNVPVTLLSVFLVYGAVKWLNEITQNLGKSEAGVYSVIKIPLAVAFGIGAATLLATTDFAGQQQFFGRTLANMNIGSQIVVGITLGFGAVGLDTTFKTVRNVGSNDSTLEVSAPDITPKSVAPQASVPVVPPTPGTGEYVPPA